MIISIITITYNSAETIENTIKSVINQDYSGIEYIVVDGGSKDSTLEIIKKYEKNVSVLVSEKDDGIYDAMNKGIKLASGDVIGILNSDDIYESPDVISSVVKKFKEENAHLVYGDLLYASDVTFEQINSASIVRHWKSGGFSLSKLKYGWMPPHPSFFVISELYKKYGLFNTSYKISADYDLMLRLLRKRNLNVAYLPKVLVRMKTGGESNRSIKNMVRKSMEDFKVVQRNKTGGLFTILAKNIRKIPQFFTKP